jgi:DNA-binding NarL/FixJ family response regulator
MNIDIAIIDQNQIYRESLKVLLEQIDGFHVVYISGNGENMENFRNLPVRVILLDDGLGKEKCSELIIEAEKLWESVSILFLSMYTGEADPGTRPGRFILKNSIKMEFEKKIKQSVAYSL